MTTIARRLLAPLTYRAVRSPLDLLIDADARWRETRHLSRLSEASLRDAGLTRAQARGCAERPHRGMAGSLPR